MAITTTRKCLDCGGNVFLINYKGSCKQCSFVKKMRDAWGVGVDADRLVYMFEGEDAHDRLLKHEGARTVYMAEFMRKCQEAWECKDIGTYMDLQNGWKELKDV